MGHPRSLMEKPGQPALHNIVDFPVAKD